MPLSRAPEGGSCTALLLLPLPHLRRDSRPVDGACSWRPLPPRVAVHTHKHTPTGLAVPLQGVCFGHQLVGTAYGARVGRAGCFECGLREVTVRPEAKAAVGEAAWVALLPDALVINECHQDQVRWRWLVGHTHGGPAERAGAHHLKGRLGSKSMPPQQHAANGCCFFGCESAWVPRPSGCRPALPWATCSHTPPPHRS